MSQQDIKFRVAFNCVPEIGRVRLHQLEQYFGSLESAWQAPAGEFKQAGMPEHAIDNICSVRAAVSPDDEMAKLEKLDIKACSYDDSAYPSILREIYDYPPLIYLRGQLTADDATVLAVVGYP